MERLRTPSKTTQGDLINWGLSPVKKLDLLESPDLDAILKRIYKDVEVPRDASIDSHNDSDPPAVAAPDFVEAPVIVSAVGQVLETPVKTKI
jgi:hypothetical protein